MSTTMTPKEVFLAVQKSIGKRQLFRIRLTIGSHNYVVGWGYSIQEVIEAFKREIDGYCFQQVFDRIQQMSEEKGYQASPVMKYGTQEKVGRAIELQKEFLRNHGVLNYEVFDQDYDKNRDEWMNKNQKYWTPKYEVKF